MDRSVAQVLTQLALPTLDRGRYVRYVGSASDGLSVDRSGASAPAQVLLPKYEFTVGEVCR